MRITSGVQDYVKAIYTLQQTESPVSNGRLAAYFGFSAPTITEMVKKLEGLNMVEYQAREGVRLTESGKKIALEMIRHHRLLELYLVEALGMSWDEVHDEAEVLEHVISETLEERIAEFLGDPQFDPHGSPIPARDGSLPQRASYLLNQLEVGQHALIVEVDDDDAERLRYLAELGLIPQTPIELIARAPFDGPLTLHVGDMNQVIDARLARLIHVQSL
ncbi:MAG: metal-dependent transcriptional regulator [Herpetosiphon sp.]|nr:metal-dependent transcriptional regulator [Herpetosiphon sp.]